MQKPPAYEMDVEEMTADFTKSASLNDRDFIAAKRGLEKANPKNYPTKFLNFCKSVISQQQRGRLTIREAAYLIGNVRSDLPYNPPTQRVIDYASNLQRHPTNYKASHKRGWATLTKNIGRFA